MEKNPEKVGYYLNILMRYIILTYVILNRTKYFNKEN